MTGLATSGVPQIAWTLGYDSADNLTTVTPGGGPAYGYAYDPLSRLTLAEIIPYPYWYAAAFTYDANGNRLQHERQNDEPYEFPKDVYAYVPGTNRLSAFWGPTQSIDPPRTFGYDAAGNVTTLLTIAAVVMASPAETKKQA